MKLSEDDAAKLGAKAALGLHSAVTLTAELAALFAGTIVRGVLAPARKAAVTLSLRGLLRDAESTTRRAARADLAHRD
jgi:hypothetical protein